MDRLEHSASSSGLYFGAAVPPILAGQGGGTGKTQSWRETTAEAAVWLQATHALSSGAVEAVVGILEANLVR